MLPSPQVTDNEFGLGLVKPFRKEFLTPTHTLCRSSRSSLLLEVGPCYLRMAQEKARLFFALLCYILFHFRSQIESVKAMPYFIDSCFVNASILWVCSTGIWQPYFRT